MPSAWLHRLDQHGATLTTADAFRCNAALLAEPLHGIDEMQHDPVAAGTDRMAETDRAAVDVELVTCDRPGRGGQTEHRHTEQLVLPSGETSQHLRGKRLVDLPQLD